MSRYKETVNFDPDECLDKIYWRAAQILVPALLQGDIWRRINCCRQVALLLLVAVPAATLADLK